MWQTFKQTAQGLSKGCQMKKANFLLFFKNPIKKQTLKTFPKTESNLVMENKFLLCCNTSSQREFEIQKIEGRSKILFLEKKSIHQKEILHGQMKTTPGPDIVFNKNIFCICFSSRAFSRVLSLFLIFTSFRHIRF